MNDRTMRGLNLVFRFALELVALVALFLWGVSLSGELIVQVIFGLGAPALAMTVWALFVSPKASRRLRDPGRLAVEIVVFGAAVLAFVSLGEWILAVLLAAAVTLSTGLMFYWGQRRY
jgi:hypothetical protein